jgi:hypothetical protein
LHARMLTRSDSHTQPHTRRHTHNITKTQQYKPTNTHTHAHKLRTCVTSGTVSERRPPNMIASMGTPAGSSHLGSMIGHWRAGAVKRELGCAALKFAPGAHCRPVQDLQPAGSGPMPAARSSAPSAPLEHTHTNAHTHTHTRNDGTRTLHMCTKPSRSLHPPPHSRAASPPPHAPSHHTSMSGVSATFVNTEFARIDSIAFAFVWYEVPGATPKKPASGLIAYSFPSSRKRIHAMSSPTHSI